MPRPIGDRSLACRAGWQLLRFALLMLGVSALVFVLVGLSPIDPVQANVGQGAYLAMGAERRAVLAERWGAGQPIGERYISWLAGVLTGDWGESLRFNAPVVQVVGERLAASAALLGGAWVLSGALGFALGVVAGARRGSRLDRVICAVCYVLAATPAFWLGLVALMVFSVALGWFPLGFSAPIGASSASVTLAERIHHLILPMLTLSVTGVADIALHTREKAIGVMGSGFMRFARSRGERPAGAVVRHALRNLCLPALTLQLGRIGEFIGGSVLIEQVFSYPGLGQATVTAGLTGDAPLLVAIALVCSALVFAGNLAADALSGAVDPRLREGARADA